MPPGPAAAIQPAELSMNAWAVLAAAILVAYLVGAIPFGYLVGRLRGVDVIHQGSGNIGATNVGRVLGWRFGILVFVLDFAKGAVPTAVATALTRSPSLDLAALAPGALGVAAGLAAFLGHLFPVYLRFRGGKGVATGAGVIAVLLPVPALVALLTWVAVVSAFRYVSLASIAAVLSLCAARFWTPEPLAAANRTLTVFCLVAAALVVVRHRTNLTRLLHGNENRLRNGRTMLTVTKIIHLFALSIWFGSVVFFTFFVGLTLFDAYQKLGKQTNDRPAWFPLPADFTRADAQLDGPTEQGTRAAGYAVGQLFGPYYLLQLVCGVLVVATALSWSASVPGRVHGIRALVVILALATVLAGWALEWHVSTLRGPRDAAVAAFLHSSPADVDAARAAALAAKSQFGMWHGISLLVNFLTLGLVGAAMVMAVALPTSVVPDAGRNGSPPGARDPVVMGGATSNQSPQGELARPAT
jgi:acyl-phosphate glycerol 3-phosphate acyltransferase